jgi:hypothetical protein
MAQHRLSAAISWKQPLMKTLAPLRGFWHQTLASRHSILRRYQTRMKERNDRSLQRELVRMTAPVKAPKPAQIIQALKRVPALQRDEMIASTYLGRSVFWKTRFFDVADIYQDPIRQFSFLQRGWHRFSRLDHPVYGHIDIDRYPETRSMRRGQRVDLYGTIAKVDTVLGITLALERFDILPLTLLDRIVQREESRV